MLRKATKHTRQQPGEGGARSCARDGRAPRQRAGFTITEALATVLIVGLVTAILAGGIALASRQYIQSVSNSEAQMLCSSLQKILDTELRFTSTINAGASDENGELKVTGFESKHYKAKDTSTGGAASYTATSVLCTVVEGEGSVVVQEPKIPGQLAMASAISNEAVYNPFLGSGSYNYGLQACVTKLTYNQAGKYFSVVLEITQGSGSEAKTVEREEFTVKALNNPNLAQ